MSLFLEAHDELDGIKVCEKTFIKYPWILYQGGQNNPILGIR